MGGMNKLLAVLLLLGVADGALAFSRFPPRPLSPLSSSRAVSTVSPATEHLVRTSLFVPYWSLGTISSDERYDTLIYFGITPGTSGVNTEDAGYHELAAFEEQAAGRTSYLALRMLNSDQNFAILKNSALQETLIQETLMAAHEFGFDGVLLDLEVSALPFDSLIRQISSFNKRFYQAARKADLHYAVSLYGDTFFRIRPFDVKSMAQNSDEVMIMAYDFHKSRGNPGPNFPLGGIDRYGYDYSELIDHFGKAVPKDKLTVIFGYFGYDWTVNSDKNMVTHGVPLSLNQIKERFITECRFTACKTKRDSLSAESVVSYTDASGGSHLVWYEDTDSVAKKEAYLKQHGIHSFSYWAYTYF
jgi:spore germination protein YaaH